MQPVFTSAAPARSGREPRGPVLLLRGWRGDQRTLMSGHPSTPRPLQGRDRTAAAALPCRAFQGHEVHGEDECGEHRPAVTTALTGREKGGLQHVHTMGYKRSSIPTSPPIARHDPARTEVTGAHGGC